jgi:hypothetical protein
MRRSRHWRERMPSLISAMSSLVRRSVTCRFQPLFHKLPTDPLDRRRPRVQGFGDLHIFPAGASGAAVGLQQNPRMHQLPRPCPRQSCGSVLGVPRPSELPHILLHRRPPCLVPLPIIGKKAYSDPSVLG